MCFYSQDQSSTCLLYVKRQMSTPKISTSHSIWNNNSMRDHSTLNEHAMTVNVSDLMIFSFDLMSIMIAYIQLTG